MKNQTKAYIYGGITVLLWSTVASAFKLGLKNYSVEQLLLFSSLSSLVSIFIILAFQGKIQLLVRQGKKALLRSAFLGFINPFAYYLILFKAYELLPAQEAQPLNFTWPLVLTILSVFILKQKIRIMSIAGILISFAGVIIISTRGDIFSLNFKNPFGAFLAVSSSIFWAVFWIFNIKDERDPIVKLFLNFLFGSLFLFVLNLVRGFQGVGNPYMLIYPIYIGLIEMGITFYFWLKALSLSSKSSSIANLIYVTPFASLIVISFVLNEKILISSVAGLIFIISGILLNAYVDRKTR